MTPERPAMTTTRFRSGDRVRWTKGDRREGIVERGSEIKLGYDGGTVSLVQFPGQLVWLVWLADSVLEPVQP